MPNRERNRTSIMFRMIVAAVCSLIILGVALYLLETGRAHRAFGLPWGPQPNGEAMILRAMFINLLQLSVVFLHNLFSGFDVITNRLRRGMKRVYYFSLVVSWAGLILRYFNSPTLNKISAFVGILGISGILLSVYIYFALIRVYRIIEERLKNEEEMADNYYNQLTTDALTGLPNRMLFQSELSDFLVKFPFDQHAVLYMDLDGFKLINDTLGHRTGDLLLKTVSESLQAHLKEGQRVYRLGGDEFVFILPHVKKGVAEAEQLAQELLTFLKEPLLVDGHELFISTSIGISIFPEDAKDMATLFKNADMAMYRAKDLGRGNYQRYDAQLNEQATMRLALEKDMRKAIERDEFLLYYQPQVDLKTGEVVGMEALVRWMHPTRGLVPPGQFIPLAEDTKLILPIGEWVLRTACQQTKRWHEAGFTNLRVSVNLSAHQFQQANLVATVKKALEESGLDPQFLDLEITESMTMHSVDRAIALMHELTSLGIQMSIDDFGTSYSSLNYLKKFPIQTLKIDQSFVRDIPHNPDDSAIATAIIAMAHSLNLNVIAEGVETQEQLQFLRGRRCNEMQGYYFSRPLPTQEFEKLLAENKQLPVEVEFGINI